jgi:uncharacterized protein DUF6152
VNRFFLSAMLVSASCLFSGSSRAHHSLASFDVSAPLWIKGTVVRFDRVNPHSLIFMDEKTPDGKVRRWAVDGPSTVQLERKGLDQDFLKAGEVLEVCGFALKDGVASQRTLPKADGASPSGPSLTGLVINGTVLVTPDGKKRVWSDYGQLQKCISPEDQGVLVR